MAVQQKDQHAAERVRLNLRSMTTRLGELLRLHRAVHGTSVRAQASDIGVTKSTLQRMENAEAGGMTVDTFLKVVSWLLSPAKGEPLDSTR